MNYLEMAKKFLVESNADVRINGAVVPHASEHLEQLGTKPIQITIGYSDGLSVFEHARRCFNETYDSSGDVPAGLWLKKR